jgi:peptidoglycan-associated lipoprotein
MSRVLATAFIALLSACATQHHNIETEPHDPSLANAARAQAIDEMMRNFHRVHFQFDSAEITDDSREALAANAEIMTRFDSIGLEVQGHCDETGSTEYNLVLGQRRADAIRRYLVTAGVASTRVTTISYGEEVPLVKATQAAELAMNRRAEFRVTIAPSVSVHGTVADSDDQSVERLAQRY